MCLVEEENVSFSVVRVSVIDNELEKFVSREEFTKDTCIG